MVQCGSKHVVLLLFLRLPGAFLQLHTLSARFPRLQQRRFCFMLLAFAKRRHGVGKESAGASAPRVSGVDPSAVTGRRKNPRRTQPGCADHQLLGCPAPREKHVAVAALCGEKLAGRPDKST